MRYPSYLSSCSHSSPDGGSLTSVASCGRYSEAGTRASRTDRTWRLGAQVVVEHAAERAFLACGLAEQPLALLTAHAGLQLVDRAAQPVERRTRAMADERDAPGGVRETHAVDRGSDVHAQSLEERQVAGRIGASRFGVGERQRAEDLT